MHTSQQKSVQRSESAASVQQAARGRNIQLKGMDLATQEASLSPDAEKGFDAQDAELAPVQMHGGKDGCATTPDKLGVKAADLSVEQFDGILKVTGSLTLSDGTTVAVSYRGEDSGAKNASVAAYMIAGDHNLSKAGQDMVKAAVAAKLGK